MMSLPMTMMFVRAIVFVVLALPTAVLARETVAVLCEGDKSDALAKAVRGGLGNGFAPLSEDDWRAVLQSAGVDEDAVWTAARKKQPQAQALLDALATKQTRALIFMTTRPPAAKKVKARLIVLDVATNAQIVDDVLLVGKTVKRTTRLDTKVALATIRKALANLSAPKVAPPVVSQAAPRPSADEEIEMIDVEPAGGTPTETVESIDVVDSIETIEGVSTTASEERPPLEHKRDTDALIIAQARVGTGLRSFTFNQPLSAGLREYGVAGSLALRGTLGLYPVRWQGNNGLRRALGLEVDYFKSPGLRSRVQDTDAVVRTEWQEWRVGPSLRLELTPFVLSGSLTYGAHDFSFQADDAELAAQLPNVAYRYVRLACDTETEVASWLFLHAGAGLRLLYGVGPLVDADRFPNSQQAALDANLGASFPISDGASLLAQAHYTHVYYDFRSAPGDTRVAGGAFDLYATFYLGAQYAY